MDKHDYIIHFVDPDIKIVESATVGDVAVLKAILKLEKLGVYKNLLECKIDWKRAELI